MNRLRSLSLTNKVQLSLLVGQILIRVFLQRQHAEPQFNGAQVAIVGPVLRHDLLGLH